MSDSDQVPLEPLVVSLDAPRVAAALPAYRGFLAGHRSLLPRSPGPDGDDLSALMSAGSTGKLIATGTLISCTSGSTGTPKGALLRSPGVRAAITASATFLHERTGYGPGPWLLALPPHHIAGTMVILRSMAAGYSPAVLDLQGKSFSASAFIAATVALKKAHPNQPLYTSLVPTQLARLLGAASGPKTGIDPNTTKDALRSYAAILVGGGPTSHSLVSQAEELGISVFLTYGSSETCGGVIYNGEALPGYSVHINTSPNTALAGRLELSGPSIAEGYRATAALNPATEFDAFPTPTTFRTTDLGEFRDGVLTILGRSDGAINSGGMKILPEHVEDLCERYGFSVCASGVPHPEWGEAVAVLIEKTEEDSQLDILTDASHFADLSAVFRTILRTSESTTHLVPHYVFATDHLPRTSLGKPDRVQVKKILTTLVQGLAAH